MGNQGSVIIRPAHAGHHLLTWDNDMIAQYWQFAQEDRMTRMDWVKAILGGILVAALFWGFTALVFVL